MLNFNSRLFNGSKNILFRKPLRIFSRNDIFNININRSFMTCTNKSGNFGQPKVTPLGQPKVTPLGQPKVTPLGQRLSPKVYDELEEYRKSFYDPVEEISFKHDKMIRKLVYYEPKTAIPAALTDLQIERLPFITKAQYYTLSEPTKDLFEEVLDNNDTMYGYYRKIPKIEKKLVPIYSTALTLQQIQYLNIITPEQYDILPDNLKTLFNEEEEITGWMGDERPIKEIWYVKKPSIDKKNMVC
jgi:hypothetical protein